MASDPISDALEPELGAEIPQQARRARRRRRDVRATAPARAKASDLRPVTALLAATIVLSMLAVGSVHVPVLLVVCPLALATGVAALLRRTAGTPPLPVPALITAALSAYCVLQAVPLPAALTRALSPQNAEVWQGALALLGPGASARWISISLDPGASLVEALKWAAYAAVFVAAASIAAERGLSRIAGLVFGSALLATVVTLVHRLLHAEALFGLYRPQYASPSFAMAPLLNSNNLAGYLNLGAFAGLGLFAGRKTRFPAWVIGLGVASVIGLSAVCGSRAGFTSLLLGAVCLLILLWRARFNGAPQSRALLGLQAGIFALGFGLFALGANSEVWAALLEESTKKIELFSWTRPLIARHFALGIGRGSFETVFPAYRVDTGNHFYQFAENFVMQWCSEWGVPVAAAALLGFAVVLRPSRIGALRSPLALCCSVGVGVLLLQNLLDLALEVASVSLALFALLGGLWGSNLAATTAEAASDSAVAPPRRVAALVVGLAGALLTGLAAYAGLATPLRDRAMVAALPQALKGASDQGKTELLARLAAAVRRHPADPFLSLISALTFTQHGGARLDWVARAIERDPMAGEPYLLLAQVFAAHGKADQSLLAVRMAAERDNALIQPGLKIALKMAASDDVLMQAVPAGQAGSMFLCILAGEPSQQERRASLLEESIARDASFARPQQLRAEDLLESLEHSSDPCQGMSLECQRRVTQLAGSLAKIEPASSRAVVFSARLLLLQGRLREAEHLLAERCEGYVDAPYCLSWRTTIASKLGPEAFQDAAAAYLAAACSDAEACADAATWIGGKYAESGNSAGALKMFERAARESGSKAAWQRVATLSQKMGLNFEAERAWRKAGEDADPTVLRELEKARLNSALGAATTP